MNPARLIVPTPARSQAIVVQVTKFNMRDTENILGAHDGQEIRGTDYETHLRNRKGRS